MLHNKNTLEEFFQVAHSFLSHFAVEYLEVGSTTGTRNADKVSKQTTV